MGREKDLQKVDFVVVERGNLSESHGGDEEVGRHGDCDSDGKKGL